MYEQSGGFIKIFRPIRKHWIWEDEKKLKWWLDILMSVNYTDTKINIGLRIFEVKRGQTIKSQETFAKAWRVDRSAVRRFLELLESDQMIITENLHKTTRITVCNYDLYNDSKPQDDRETTAKRPRNDREVNTEKNSIRKNKKEEEGKEEYSASLLFLTDEDRDFNKFCDWLEKNAPRVLKMQQPFTLAEYLELKTYPNKEVAEILQAMHNYKPLLTKNINAFLTFKNWIARQKNNQDGTTKKYTVAGNQNDAVNTILGSIASKLAAAGGNPGY